MKISPNPSLTKRGIIKSPFIKGGYRGIWHNARRNSDLELPKITGIVPPDLPGLKCGETIGLCPYLPYAPYICI